MNFDRPRWGEWIAAIAGLWLVVLVFRAWYEVADIDAAVTAMDAFDFEHIVFLTAGAVGIFSLLLVASERDDELGFPFGAVVAVLGLIATALAAYRIASPPADDLDAALGAYLGLLASLGVAAGGLMAAREAGAPGLPAAAPAGAGSAEGAAGDDAGGAPQDWSAPPAPAGGSWSPAPPAPSTAGGSPGGAATEDPSAPIRAGDTVELIEGSIRFPAGTTGTVVETFGGGALVEVRGDAGNAERVEVPSDAIARPGAPSGGAGWSPALPAAAAGTAAAGRQEQDWGFDEPAGASVAEPPPAAEPLEGPETTGADGEEAVEKPGFFGRLFGRKPKDEDGTEAIAGPGVESAAPSDQPGDWESPAAATEPDYASGIPDTTGSAVDAAAPEAEAAAVEAPAPEAADLPAEPEAAPAEPEDTLAQPPVEARSAEPEPLAADAAPEPPVAEAIAPEPPAAEAPAPEAAPEPPAAEAPAPEARPAEPAPGPSEPAVTEPAGGEPEPAAEPAPAESGDLAAAGAAGGAAAAAGSEGAAAEEPAPAKKKAAKKRRKSSASIKRPTEAAPGGARAPEIGDEVELQVSGGKWEAGTRGTVVDSFAAGVIVEVYGEDGKAERLDLPFEAVSIVES